MARKSDGSVLIETLFDTSGFDRGARQINNKMGSLMSTVSKLGVVVAAAFSARTLINFGKEAIDLGSDLQEVQNVVDVTFTTMSDKVDEFARNAAETAGLSETMAKKFTGTFGAMANAFGFAEEESFAMSTSLAQLAGDVASFYNLTQDEAYTKLKSVFTGETETLKDLGVVMTQNALDAYAMEKGYGKTTKQMSEQEKVALRYSFVLDQLSAAQGDFVRTSDSWANQTRILSLNFDSFKANIGKALINVFTPFLKVINQIVDKMAELSTHFVAFSEMIVGKQTSGGGGSPGKAQEEIAKGYEDIADATGEATKAQNKYLTGLDEIQTFTAHDDAEVNLNVGASGDITAVTDDIKNESDKISLLIEDIKSKYPEIIDTAEKIVDLSKGLFSNLFAGDFEAAGENLSQLVAGINEFISEVIDSVDWKNIGGKISGFLAGIDWLDVIKSGIKLKFNIWEAIAEVWLGAFDAAPFETAIITAFSLMKLTPIGEILSQKLAGAINPSAIMNSLKEWTSGGLTGGGGFFSKLGDSLAMTFGGAGTLGESLTATFGTLATTISGIVGIVVGAITAITNFVDMLKNGFSWLNEALMLVGIAIAAIGAIILGAPALVAGIVAGIVAAIATLVVVIKDNWSEISAWFGELGEWFSVNVVEPIVGFFKDLCEKIGNFFIELWKNISLLWEGVSQWFSENVIDPIIGFFQGLWKRVKQIFEGLLIIVQAVWMIVGEWFSENVVEPIVETFDSFKEKSIEIFENAVNAVKEKWSSISLWFKSNVITPITEFFTPIGEKIGGAFRLAVSIAKKAWENVANWFKEKIAAPIEKIFSKMWKGIGTAFSIGINALAVGLETAINFIISGINGIIGGFNKVVSWAAKITEQDWGGVELIPEVSIPRVNVPMLATGAVIPPNAPFLAMLGDQKHGTNIEAPLDVIKQAVREVVGNGGGGGKYQFIAQLNRRTLFDEIIDEAKLRKDIMGFSPFELT